MIDSIYHLKNYLFRREVKHSHGVYASANLMQILILPWSFAKHSTILAYIRLNTSMFATGACCKQLGDRISRYVERQFAAPGEIMEKVTENRTVSCI